MILLMIVVPLLVLILLSVLFPDAMRFLFIVFVIFCLYQCSKNTDDNPADTPAQTQGAT